MPRQHTHVYTKACTHTHPHTAETRAQINLPRQHTHVYTKACTHTHPHTAETRAQINLPRQHCDRHAKKPVTRNPESARAWTMSLCGTQRSCLGYKRMQHCGLLLLFKGMKHASSKLEVWCASVRQPCCQVCVGSYCFARASGTQGASSKLKV